MPSTAIAPAVPTSDGGEADAEQRAVPHVPERHELIEPLLRAVVTAAVAEAREPLADDLAERRRRRRDHRCRQKPDQDDAGAPAR